MRKIFTNLNDETIVLFSYITKKVGNGVDTLFGLKNGLESFP